MAQQEIEHTQEKQKQISEIIQYIYNFPWQFYNLIIFETIPVYQSSPP